MKTLGDFLNPHIKVLKGYVPGQQTDDPQILKLNTNENPFPVPESVKRALTEEINADRLQKYPDPVSDMLRKELAKKYGRRPDEFLIANGSDEILSILFRAVLGPGKSIICPMPTYSLYPVLAGLVQADCVEIEVNSKWRIDFPAMLKKMNEPTSILCAFANPNAPTGIAESVTDVLNFAKNNPGLTLVDEAYADFWGQTVFPKAGTEMYPRLLVSGTASKALSLAGQRIGWICASGEFIRELEKIKDSYNLSRLAQTAALAALRDELEFKERTATVVENRNRLVQSLDKLGFETLESSANFIYTKPPARFAELYATHSSKTFTPAGACFQWLLEQKVLVRYWDTHRLRDYVRITIGTAEQMNRLLVAVEKLLLTPST